MTGASGTIGFCIAQTLAQHGASVVLTGRRRDRLEAVAQRISGSHVLPCDVTKEESVMQLFDAIDRLPKPLGILVNNAGINVTGASTDISGRDFQSVMDVNVLGPFLCSREFFRRSSGGGRIINIGSLSAASPRPDSCPYTTSKFALQGLTQSMALDGRSKGIAVGIIHPGNVQSELLTPEMIAARESEGFLEAQSVADCVLHMSLLPSSANILEMTVLPTQQPFQGRG